MRRQFFSKEVEAGNDSIPWLNNADAVEEEHDVDFVVVVCGWGVLFLAGIEADS